MIVYRFTNLINGKVYIGQTVKPLKVRRHLHDWSIRKGRKQAIHFAIAKYGWENFRIETLYAAKSIAELNAMETFFIILHQSHLPENGYNRNRGGYKRKNVGQIPWNKGKSGSQVAWNKGMKMSEEYREKCRRRYSPEMLERLIVASKTKPRSPRPNQSVKFLGTGNPFFGKKHSASAKRKMRAAKVGLPIVRDTLGRISSKSSIEPV